jgi:NDP-sugar pyrophosphorylase family protein
VDSLANVHSSAIVEVGAVVHAHAHVGPNTHILSGCIVGPNVNVGSSTTLGYNVVLQNCSVGNSCILHSGVCVGQDGVYTMSLSIFLAAAQSTLFVFLSLLPLCSLHYVSFFLSCCSAVYFTMSFSAFLLHNV